MVISMAGDAVHIPGGRKHDTVKLGRIPHLSHDLRVTFRAAVRHVGGGEGRRVAGSALAYGRVRSHSPPEAAGLGI